MERDNIKYITWVLEQVNCLTTLTKKQQEVCSRQILAQDGPTDFLYYTETLNAAANAGLIKEKKARKTFNIMSDVYFEQYDAVA
jgi:hypothetical protein